MEIVLLLLFFGLGSAVGSFLNVCIDRLPAGKSINYPPSHCDACQRRLSPLDMVPVLSYLLLHGRCRYCQALIPRRILWVEISTGFLFASLYWHYGLGVELAVNAFYFSVFLVLAVIDLEHKLILDRIIYPVAALALIIDFFLPGPGILSGVIGAVAGLVLLLIPALLFPQGMGMGDVKLAALIGLVTGFPLVFVALFLGIISGGAVAIILVLSRVRKRKDSIPFGPFLSLGSMVTLVWGGIILDWYRAGW